MELRPDRINFKYPTPSKAKFYLTKCQMVSAPGRFQPPSFLTNAYISGYLSVISYGIPWVLILILPLSVLLFTVQTYYRYTSRDLKRLERLALSPVHSHFNETLSGRTTIRALGDTLRYSLTTKKILRLYMFLSQYFCFIIPAYCAELRTRHHRYYYWPFLSYSN